MQRKKQAEEKEKNSLLNELWDKLSREERLYSTLDELKQKQKEYLTGGASSIEKGIKSTHTIQERNIQNGHEEKKDDWTTDEDFKKAMKYVLGVEGGYSNRKEDLGGKTNYGITQNTFDYYNKKHNITQKDIKNITKEEAMKIYYDDFWKASGANKIEDNALKLMHFDAAINHGIGGAKRYYQKSKGDYDKYKLERKNYYNNRVIERPDQKVFHKGWLNRLDRLDKYILENY